MAAQDSFEFFVDHCLMRPRFLINIIENAISNAVNRGHMTVQEVDCVDAVRQHSLYLVDDFGYEIRMFLDCPPNCFIRSLELKK